MKPLFKIENCINGKRSKRVILPPPSPPLPYLEGKGQFKEKKKKQNFISKYFIFAKFVKTIIGLEKCLELKVYQSDKSLCSEI